jgi:hypothetical protein
MEKEVGDYLLTFFTRNLFAGGSSWGPIEARALEITTVN